MESERILWKVWDIEAIQVLEVRQSGEQSWWNCSEMPTANVHNCEVKEAISSFLKKMQSTDHRVVREVDLTTLWRKWDMGEVILVLVEPLVEEEAMVAEVVM